MALCWLEGVPVSLSTSSALHLPGPSHMLRVQGLVGSVTVQLAAHKGQIVHKPWLPPGPARGLSLLSSRRSAVSSQPQCRVLRAVFCT